MLADFSICAEGAIRPACSATYCGFPHMRVAVWTLITLPPHLLAAVGCDGDAAQVSVLAVVPLLLHCESELTDVRASFPAGAAACASVWCGILD